MTGHSASRSPCFATPQGSPVQAPEPAPLGQHGLCGFACCLPLLDLLLQHLSTLSLDLRSLLFNHQLRTPANFPKLAPCISSLIFRRYRSPSTGPHLISSLSNTFAHVCTHSYDSSEPLSIHSSTSLELLHLRASWREAWQRVARRRR